MKFKYLDLITASFVTVLIVSNITSVKILSLGPFSFDGGTILFPLSYIFGDILTEVYGYARSRRVIWTGFAMNFITVLIFALVTKLPRPWTGPAKRPLPAWWALCPALWPRVSWPIW